MIRVRAILLLGLFVASASATGMDQPKGTVYDSRIQHVNYNEDDVVQLNAYPGISTQIMFADGEKILDVTSGFTAGWQFKPRRNNLYLMPQSLAMKGEGGKDIVEAPEAGKWDTNLIVTTDQHVYSFMLTLRPGRADGKLGYDPRVAFRVKFHYPADELAKAQAASDKKVAQAKLDVAPVARNWQYSMQAGKNSANIQPSQAFDDGRFTYLKFPNNREIPAIFLVDDSGAEATANTHIDPKKSDVVVVERVAKRLVLRLGSAVVGVYNDNYDADGVPPTNGTTVPGVERTVKVVNGDETR